MKRVLLFVFALLFATAAVSGQTKPRPRATPAAKPVAAPTIERGTISGRTYTHKTFGFEVIFPDTWLIPGDDFEEYMRKQGFDLGLKAPDSLPLAQKAAVNKALKRVQILLTAYRSMPGSDDNAIVRISVEDLAQNPQIKDAVDYFDAIRASYKMMRLPADFKYGETQAERLGAMQFGYLDVSSKAGMKRMYATVRQGHAVMFTISYTEAADLESLRWVLTEGNFSLK